MPFCSDEAVLDDVCREVISAFTKRNFRMKVLGNLQKQACQSLLPYYVPQKDIENIVRQIAPLYTVVGGCPMTVSVFRDNGGFYFARTADGGILSVDILFSPIIGAGIMLLTFFTIYTGQRKKLQEEISEKRKKIERELPQLAGTIRQSLNTSRDVVKMLESYRKICEKTLLTEIDITLNDINTGNEERALKSLESRVSSPKFSELIRGLIGVIRGDGQRIYFEMLSKDFSKFQDEMLKQELLKRPAKLKPYIVTLLCCMLFIFIAAIGSFVIDKLNILM